MIQATTKMYRDNGDMFFLWVISDDDGVLGHIDGVGTSGHAGTNGGRESAEHAIGDRLLRHHHRAAYHDGPKRAARQQRSPRSTARSFCTDADGTGRATRTGLRCAMIALGLADTASEVGLTDETGH